jgi:hypothetical protein
MTLPAQLPPLGLNGIVLKSGSHKSRESGVCALEAVAWFAGLPHSDMPACVCPVLRAFVIAWNDAIPDDARRTALLKPFIPKLLDTTSTAAVESTRSYLALDWLVRVHTPAWLDLTPASRPHAEALRALAPLVDTASAAAASPPLNAARDAAARAASRAAARAAARDAAARAASRAAARDAARDAAAWAAARDAAAWAAAAWAAAAAGANLQPTVEQLQASAVELLDRMIAVTE